ncbi:MAG: hypothetical protein E7Z73_07825 [Methanobrevibacter millerae]|uniref:ADP ribosyltransferase domain-containing protein n=1 Tax=Methanobrevibacter millerae TaxID=230361 RepID=A0A8T3VBW9_9EURY|nr:ADP-ribosyltransferase [Methanobrevibacter millerae]MBE6505629.1 hypothetical protein [Methanobrevibacter millerae]
MTNREILEYALKAQRLHEVLVLKDDIHLQYKYKNINRAASQAATFQDKIIDAVIEDAVTGTSDPIKKSTVNRNVEKIIDTNLKNDTKRISYGIPEKAVEAAVSNISNRYQFILGNRIREEIPNLQGKIEDYINTKNLGNLSEAELTEKLKSEYGEHAQKRIKNIIRDSFHTNECNLSWIKAIYDGYQYKSWNNGRTKRTRVWHKAKFIESVPIDETFDIYGSYPARMMYPGDLNGGAENVANCRCWLSYSNRPPSDIRGSGKKSTTQTRKSKKSNKSKNNNDMINKVTNSVKKPVKTVKSKIKSVSEKVTSKIKPQKQNSKIDYTKFELDNLHETFEKDKNKAVKIGDKTVYGVEETKSARTTFEIKYGITKDELTKDEYKFIKLYSGKGFSILNEYLRKIANIDDSKLNEIKKEYSIKWLKLIFYHPQYYMSFDKSLKILNDIFEKGKVLEEDLVVVRRQKEPMSNRAEDGIYHSDACLSTSLSENVKPEEYGDYVNYIVISKGTKILYIEGVTYTRWEYEVLLDKNIDLQLIKEESEYLAHWELL